jgi:hypothetical protein
MVREPAVEEGLRLEISENYTEETNYINYSFLDDGRTINSDLFLYLILKNGTPNPAEP